MSINTYTDPVFTTELREWIQNDTFVYEGSEYDVDVVQPAWNKGLKTGPNGYVYTAEDRERMSEYGKTLIGEKNPFYGKKHSTESKKLISENRKGKGTKSKSEETKRRMSENMKRRWADVDSRKKLIETNRNQYSNI